MLGTGYFLKIAKINSQQEKLICPNIIAKIISRKAQKIAKIRKNKLQREILCQHSVGQVPALPGGRQARIQMYPEIKGAVS